jgi:hypothetical protein
MRLKSRHNFPVVDHKFCIAPVNVTSRRFLIPCQKCIKRPLVFPGTDTLEYTGSSDADPYRNLLDIRIRPRLLRAKVI